MTAEAQRTTARLRIMEDLWASWRTQALVAGIELGVFTHIAEGSRTPKAIARAAQASERGIERLLNALVGIGYLAKSPPMLAFRSTRTCTVGVPVSTRRRPRAGTHNHRHPGLPLARSRPSSTRCKSDRESTSRHSRLNYPVQ